MHIVFVDIAEKFLGIFDFILDTLSQYIGTIIDESADLLEARWHLHLEVYLCEGLLSLRQRAFESWGDTVVEVEDYFQPHLQVRIALLAQEGFEAVHEAFEDDVLVSGEGLLELVQHCKSRHIARLQPNGAVDLNGDILHVWVVEVPANIHQLERGVFPVLLLQLELTAEIVELFESGVVLVESVAE